MHVSLIRGTACLAGGQHTCIRVRVRLCVRAMRNCLIALLYLSHLSSMANKSAAIGSVQKHLRHHNLIRGSLQPSLAAYAKLSRVAMDTRQVNNHHNMEAQHWAEIPPADFVKHHIFLARREKERERKGKKKTLLIGRPNI